MPFFLLLFTYNAVGQNPFRSGEKVTYDVAYHWGLMWVDAGVVEFIVQDTVTSDGVSSYYFKGFGKTLPRWDWFYKVRDTYASIATKHALQPTYFYRSVREGNTFIERTYKVDYTSQKVHMTNTTKSGESITTSFAMQENANDVLTMIYAARKIRFDGLSIGEEIPIQLILDGQIYDTYITFEGYEWAEVENKGFIECIKFKPKLIKGTIFPGGENMEVWVSKDANRIPVLIKTPILVGDIEVNIRNVQGANTPLKFYEDQP